MGDFFLDYALNPGAKREEGGNPVTVLITGQYQLRIASIPERMLKAC